jgi:hypothetical protein
MDDDSEIEIRFFNRNYFCLARAQSVGGAVQDPPRRRAWMLSQRTPVDFRGAAVKKPPRLSGQKELSTCQTFSANVGNPT